MEDKNEIMIIGTVFREPKCGRTKNGNAMAQFTVAVKRPDPSSAQDLLSVVAWNEQAEKFAKNFGEGSRIKIEGHLTHSSYVGQDGVRRSSTKITALSIEEDKVLFEEEDRVYVGTAA